MSRFLEQALEIFDTAEAASAAGHDPADLTISISATGGIHMVAGCDWPLDALQAHRGAEMVYRVSQQNNSVRLEGRAGFRTCLFETAKPDGAARQLLAGAARELLRPMLPAPVLATSSNAAPAARPARFTLAMPPAEDQPRLLAVSG